MREPWTFNQAIAFLTYGSAKIAARYGGPDNTRDGGASRRARDLFYPKSSGLPGTEELGSVSGPALATAMAAWKAADATRWEAALENLHRARRDGIVTVYDSVGAIYRGTWLALDTSAARALRFDGAELMALLGIPDTGEDVEPPPTLPEQFTLMQAAVWSSTRDARKFGRLLPFRVNGEERPPADWTDIRLDIYAADSADTCASSENAIAQLREDLHAARLTSTGLCAETGERCPIGSDEWAHLILDMAPEGHPRGLMPWRSNDTKFAVQLETRWRDTLIPRDQLMSLYPTWPLGGEPDAAVTPEPADALGSEVAELRKAPKATIRKVMQAEYDAAELGRAKPPNVVQIVGPVLARLQAAGFTATHRQVQAVAREDCFEKRRLDPGKRMQSVSP